MAWVPAPARTHAYVVHNPCQAQGHACTPKTHLTVGHLVALLEGGGGCGGLHLLLEVEGNVRELLLDVAGNFALGSGGEGVAALHHDLHEVVGQIATGLRVG